MSKRPGRRHLAIAKAAGGSPDPFTPAEIASVLKDAFTVSCWPAAVDGGAIRSHRLPRLRALAGVLVDRLRVDIDDLYYTWPELVNVLVGAALTVQLAHCQDDAS